MPNCKHWVKKHRRNCRNPVSAGNSYCSVHQKPATSSSSSSSENSDASPSSPPSPPQLSTKTPHEKQTTEKSEEKETPVRKTEVRSRKNSIPPRKTIQTSTTLSLAAPTISQQITNVEKQIQELSLNATTIAPEQPPKGFVYDNNATLYAQELLGDEIDVGEGVKVIKLTTILQSNEITSPYLVTRDSSRALWGEVHKYISTTPHTHAVVTGTPGIGKSRSMMYLLRLLLQDNKIVFYEPRKEGVIYAFIPTPQGYKAFSIESKNITITQEPLLKDPSNYLLVDPYIPSPILLVRAHTVVACSPNVAHHHEFAKREYTETFFMPLWARQELALLASYMNITKSAAGVDQLFEIFGGVPRLVFAPTESNLVKLEAAINNLDVDVMFKVLTGKEDLSTVENTKRLSSMLFCYVTTAPFKALATSTRIASEHIKFKISSCYWSYLMNKLDPSSLMYSQSPIALGRFFEGTIASSLLKFGGTFKRRNLETNIVDTLTLPRAKVVEVSNWKSYIDYVANMGKQNAQAERTLVKPAASNQPAIDFADAKDRVYQVTVSLDYGISTKYIAQFIELAKLDQQNKLHFYFVVPEHKFDQFSAQAYRGSDPSMRHKISRCVVQFVLAIPSEIPPSFTVKQEINIDDD